MNFIIKTVAALALAISCAYPQAAPLVLAAQAARPNTMYAVSGILRSKADSMVIKLVQGLAYGATREDAVEAFSRDVHAKYPTHTLIDTVATSLTVAKPACGQRI